MALVVAVTWMDGRRVTYDAVAFASEDCQWMISRDKDTVIIDRGSVREIVITDPATR